MKRITRPYTWQLLNTRLRDYVRFYSPTDRKPVKVFEQGTKVNIYTRDLLKTHEK